MSLISHSITDKSTPEKVTFTKPKIRVTSGDLFTRVETILDEPFAMKITLTLLPGKSFIAMDNEFHLKRGSFLSNKELVMRFHTELANHDTFFTDLNGFQVRILLVYKFLFDPNHSLRR